MQFAERDKYQFCRKVPCKHRKCIFCRKEKLTTDLSVVILLDAAKLIGCRILALSINSVILRQVLECMMQSMQTMQLAIITQAKGPSKLDPPS